MLKNYVQRLTQRKGADSFSVFCFSRHFTDSLSKNPVSPNGALLSQRQVFTLGTQQASLGRIVRSNTIGTVKTFPFTMRHFSSSALNSGRHWWDTLKDDDDLDKRFHDPLYSKGSTNPKPYEMELEMNAYRLEQEEKYRKIRPMTILYLVVGTVAGYVTCQSFLDCKKSSRRSKWLTRRATEELTPGIWASTTVAFFVLVEFCEACGTLGAHVPFWTLGSFAAVFLLKMVYHNAAMFLE